MSSLPGLDLEDYVMWNHDLIVEDNSGANPSLQIAEALGIQTRRVQLTSAQFSSILELYEPYRESIEYRLTEFDEDNQSWRDYASCAFDNIPDSVLDEVQLRVNSLRSPPPTQGKHMSETSFSGFVQLAGDLGPKPSLDFGQAIPPDPQLKYTPFNKDPFETLLGSLMWYAQVLGYSQDQEVVNQHNLLVRSRRETGWVVSTDFYTRLSAILFRHMKEELRKAQMKASDGNSIGTITEATATWIRCNSSASGLVSLIEEFVEQSIRDGLSTLKVPDLDDYSGSLVSDWRDARRLLARVEANSSGTSNLYNGERSELNDQRSYIKNFIECLERRMTQYCPLMLMVLRSEYEPG